jgi:hypothetical protein
VVKPSQPANRKIPSHQVNRRRTWTWRSPPSGKMSVPR